ncbi:hypothetical protein SAMN05443662_0012 [Sulfurivirga caldicuralii]|uniref:Uncharacterized protein n=1 Tax=Sulfurivirga caldicuralii TaxID=364032 RepID=A0A1N6DBH9_9GAMM|nr:hypothetical protein [Sulfurivirga caldicuralii]SIN68150.1 hypothetical protein SAMN05443662_0012 [Sulfurivirga caldicuralii]
MSDTPQPKRRVIDGEVVEPKTTSSAEPKAKTPKEKDNSTGGRDWIARGLAIVALGVGSTALLTQPDGAALVEADNQLQQQITQLQAELKTLRSDKAQLAALQKELSVLKDTVESLTTEVDMLNEKVLNPANEPLVTKGEIERLQKQMQGLQKQLGDWAQRWQKALQGLQSPQAEQGAGEAPLNALQQQLDQMGSRLSELFQAIQPPRDRAESGAVAEINTLRLKRWILTANTEWLMSGNVKLTRERLHVLEQAVQMSDLPAESKIRLLRAIGQDLAMLDAWEKQATVQPAELDQLKAWINALEAPRSGDQSVDKNAQDTDLMARLKGLVEIHKRGEVVPESDRLLAFDLVKQRARVLVDQLAWAQITHDPELDKRTRARLEALFARYLPDQLPALKAKLAQLPPPKMPQPLHVAEAL